MPKTLRHGVEGPDWEVAGRVFEGELQKGGAKLGGWVSRYFVLLTNGVMLSCIPEKEDSSSSSSSSPVSSTITLAPSLESAKVYVMLGPGHKVEHTVWADGDPRTFQVSARGQVTFHFRAQSEEDRTKWVAALRLVADLDEENQISTPATPDESDIRISTGAKGAPTQFLVRRPDRHLDMRWDFATDIPPPTFPPLRTAATPAPAAEDCAAPETSAAATSSKNPFARASGRGGAAPAAATSAAASSKNPFARPGGGEAWTGGGAADERDERGLAPSTFLPTTQTRPGRQLQTAIVYTPKEDSGSFSLLARLRANYLATLSASGLITDDRSEEGGDIGNYYAVIADKPSAATLLSVCSISDLRAAGAGCRFPLIEQGGPSKDRKRLFKNKSGGKSKSVVYLVNPDHHEENDLSSSLHWVLADWQQANKGGTRAWIYFLSEPRDPIAAHALVNDCMRLREALVASGQGHPEILCCGVAAEVRGPRSFFWPPLKQLNSPLQSPCRQRHPFVDLNAPSSNLCTEALRYGAASAALVCMALDVARNGASLDIRYERLSGRATVAACALQAHLQEMWPRTSDRKIELPVEATASQGKAPRHSIILIVERLRDLPAALLHSRRCGPLALDYLPESRFHTNLTEEVDCSANLHPTNSTWSLLAPFALPAAIRSLPFFDVFLATCLPGQALIDRDYVDNEQVESDSDIRLVRCAKRRWEFTVREADAAVAAASTHQDAVVELRGAVAGCSDLCDALEQSCVGAVACRSSGDHAFPAQLRVPPAFARLAWLEQALSLFTLGGGLQKGLETSDSAAKWWGAGRRTTSSSGVVLPFSGGVVLPRYSHLSCLAPQRLLTQGKVSLLSPPAISSSIIRPPCHTLRACRCLLQVGLAVQSLASPAVKDRLLGLWAVTLGHALPDSLPDLVQQACKGRMFYELRVLAGLRTLQALDRDACLDVSSTLNTCPVLADRRNKAAEHLASVLTAHPELAFGHRSGGGVGEGGCGDTDGEGGGEEPGDGGAELLAEIPVVWKPRAADWLDAALGGTLNTDDFDTVRVGSATPAMTPTTPTSAELGRRSGQVKPPSTRAAGSHVNDVKSGDAVSVSTGRNSNKDLQRLYQTFSEAMHLPAEPMPAVRRRPLCVVLVLGGLAADEEHALTEVAEARGWDIVIGSDADLSARELLAATASPEMQDISVN